MAPKLDRQTFEVSRQAEYLDPRELADRYALDGHQQTLERQAAVLTKLTAAAAS